VLKVLFFASVREQLGVDHLTCALEPTVALLIATLIRTHGAKWNEILNAPNMIVAVNHDVVARDYVLHAGDEVAFFPPVTGG
jgi:sulfur-carrier protein